MSYLFQDTERAARRLQIVADVFAFSSRPFLQTVVDTAPELPLIWGAGRVYHTPSGGGHAVYPGHRSR